MLVCWRARTHTLRVVAPEGCAGVSTRPASLTTEDERQVAPKGELADCDVAGAESERCGCCWGRKLCRRAFCLNALQQKAAATPHTCVLFEWRARSNRLRLTAMADEQSLYRTAGGRVGAKSYFGVERTAVIGTSYKPPYEDDCCGRVLDCKERPSSAAMALHAARALQCTCAVRA